MITWDDFKKVEMHAGTVISAEDFPKARNPSYKLTVDFGALGTKRACAQITKLYRKDELVGRQVIAVTNFPPKQIADFMSECLVLGVVLDDNEVVLVQPDRKVNDGKRIA